MKTYNEFLAESQLNEDADELRRIEFGSRKFGFNVTPIKKVGGFSYKVGDFTFGNKGSGQWQIVDKKGKEVDYLFGKKLSEIIELMDEYSQK